MHPCPDASRSPEATRDEVFAALACVPVFALARDAVSAIALALAIVPTLGLALIVARRIRNPDRTTALPWLILACVASASLVDLALRAYWPSLHASIAGSAAPIAASCSLLAWRCIDSESIEARARARASLLLPVLLAGFGVAREAIGHGTIFAGASSLGVGERGLAIFPTGLPLAAGPAGAFLLLALGLAARRLAGSRRASTRGTG